MLYSWLIQKTVKRAVGISALGIHLCKGQKLILWDEIKEVRPFKFLHIRNLDLIRESGEKLRMHWTPLKRHADVKAADLQDVYSRRLSREVDIARSDDLVVPLQGHQRRDPQVVSPGVERDEDKEINLNGRTLQWMVPQERPLLLARTTNWGWSANQAQGQSVDLRLGVDIYNASDTRLIGQMR